MPKDRRERYVLFFKIASEIKNVMTMCVIIPVLPKWTQA